MSEFTGFMFSVLEMLNYIAKSKEKKGEHEIIVVTVNPKEKSSFELIVQYMKSLAENTPILIFQNSSSNYIQELVKKFIEIFSLDLEKISTWEIFPSKKNPCLFLKISEEKVIISQIFLIYGLEALAESLKPRGGDFGYKKERLYENLGRDFLNFVDFIDSFKLKNIQIGTKKGVEIDLVGILDHYLLLISCKSYSFIENLNKLDLERRWYDLPSIKKLNVKRFNKARFHFLT